MPITVSLWHAFILEYLFDSRDFHHSTVCLPIQDLYHPFLVPARPFIRVTAGVDVRPFILLCWIHQVSYFRKLQGSFACVTDLSWHVTHLLSLVVNLLHGSSSLITITSPRFQVKSCLLTFSWSVQCFSFVQLSQLKKTWCCPTRWYKTFPILFHRLYSRTCTSAAPAGNSGDGSVDGDSKPSPCRRGCQSHNSDLPLSQRSYGQLIHQVLWHLQISWEVQRGDAI